MATNLLPWPREVVEITDSSDEEQDVRLEDFMTNREFEDVLHQAFGLTPGPIAQDNHIDAEIPAADTAPIVDVQQYEECRRIVLDVFPDVSHDHLRSLYDDHIATGEPVLGASSSEALISQLLDGGKYPKEKDRLNELKRKRSLKSDDERASTWTNNERVAGDYLYPEEAKNLLQEDFPDVPRRYIDIKFKELGNLYATFLALDLSEEAYDTSESRPYIRLKNTRKSKRRRSVEMPATGYGVAELQRELEAARFQRKKLQTQRQTKKDAAAAEAAVEKELRDNNQIMECGCCFEDFPLNKITFCNAENPHAFCFGCATQHANTQIGLTQFVLTCMDTETSCEAIFGRQERERFLDPKTVEKLERLQQQKELREANLPNLETCPFCDFAAICPPIEVDKEFRCDNPECQRVSCRKCRLVTHIPMSCEEFRKENGVSERHLIEEARTAAFIKQCPSCKASVFKEGGCNKVHCTQCGGFLCDVCGKNITREQYGHFADGYTSTRISGIKGKCPMYDGPGQERAQQNIENAEKETMAKIRKENPDLKEEDLQIKFKESVMTPPRGMGFGDYMLPPGRRGMLYGPPMRNRFPMPAWGLMDGVPPAYGGGRMQQQQPYGQPPQLPVRQPTTLRDQRTGAEARLAAFREGTGVDLFPGRQGRRVGEPMYPGYGDFLAPPDRPPRRQAAAEFNEQVFRRTGRWPHEDDDGADDYGPLDRLTGRRPRRDTDVDENEDFNFEDFLNEADEPRRRRRIG
ncbi:MAG: hypothetical protein Q9222_006136 [Ikaeria aurantiellina]